MNRTNITSGVVAMLALAATVWWATTWWSHEGQNESIQSVGQATDPTSSLTVLTKAKADVAGIATQTVSRRSMQLTRFLPARFAYDDRSHVAVRAATAGVIDTVFVKPGDKVEVNERIAVLRSPAVGKARSEMLRLQADLELAETERQWQSGICDGVEKLVVAIRQGKSVEEIERSIDEAPLGNYRGRLLTLYSKARLANKLSDSVTSISDAVSRRVVRQRQSEQQQARAELDAVMEQALFETSQACKSGTARADAANRSLIVARQSLATLLGITKMHTAETNVSPNETDLARLEIRSPLAGTVERKLYSATERVGAGDELFIIADTSRLWVEADVRSRDWGAMQVKQGDAVKITTHADSETELIGNVYYVGREVDPASGALPLVVELENPENRYRPGLFARVEVPIGEVSDAIAVPESAIVDLEGQPSVFVAQRGGYQRRTVKTGRTSGSLVEIQAGLQAGQQVVTSGAFVLKSELLLEGEE
jgi:RND family efflux transporter MFP subunit